MAAAARVLADTAAQVLADSAAEEVLADVAAQPLADAARVHADAAAADVLADVAAAQVAAAANVLADVAPQLLADTALVLVDVAAQAAEVLADIAPQLLAPLLLLQTCPAPQGVHLRRKRKGGLDSYSLRLVTHLCPTCEPPHTSQPASLSVTKTSQRLAGMHSLMPATKLNCATVLRPGPSLHKQEQHKQEQQHTRGHREVLEAGGENEVSSRVTAVEQQGKKRHALRAKLTWQARRAPAKRKGGRQRVCLSLLLGPGQEPPSTSTCNTAALNGRVCCKHHQLEASCQTERRPPAILCLLLASANDWNGSALHVSKPSLI